MGGPTDAQVVAVKSIAGCALEDWSEERLLPGDILSQVRAVRKIMLVVNAPFAGGKSAVQRELRKIYQAGDTIVLRVRRGERKLDIRAQVVTEELIMRKKTYLLADSSQKSCVAYLMDATEEECLALQEQTRKLMEKRRKKSNLVASPIKDCLISYPWQSKLQQYTNSAMVFSLVLMPLRGAEDGNLEDTTARSMAWLAAAQSSGVPISFVNIQSEPLFLQSSSSKYFAPGSTGDPVDIVNCGVHTLHDLEGADINVTRAVRLWYSPPEGELAITLRPREAELRLGVNITCTEEGFCYVSSVDEGTAAARAGLIKVFEAACRANKLLVVSRLAGEKITPWFVSSAGAIRCFNAISIGDKIASQREVQQSIEFYFMLWCGATDIKVTDKQASESGRELARVDVPGYSDRRCSTSTAQASTRYSESSESDKFLFDSSGSGHSLAAEALALAAQEGGCWELATTTSMDRSSSTTSNKSFSFHKIETGASHQQEAGEDFTFATDAEETQDH